VDRSISSGAAWPVMARAGGLSCAPIARIPTHREAHRVVLAMVALVVFVCRPAILGAMVPAG
jgi:hypothetical protein